MQFALADSIRIEARPQSRANCPLCFGEVLSKCGSLVAWHWAHVAEDCDAWAEPETRWHLDWKSHFRESCREVVIGNHRADIVAPNGFVVELQHSSISSEQIQERERFYGRRMIWVLDGRDFADNLDLRDKGRYYSFRWKWPRKSWFSAQRSMFVDIQDGLFLMKRLHGEVPCGGWGRFVEKGEFFAWLSAPSGGRRFASVNVAEVA